MEKQSHRPSKTTQWEISMPLIIQKTKEYTREYVRIKPDRTTITRTTIAKQTATVILGHKEGSKIIVSPGDIVFTCVFGLSGHLSRLPNEVAGTNGPMSIIGKEVTIIYKQ